MAQTAKEAGIELLYLPPYSPKLNPTEFCFNVIRNHINGMRPRNADQLDKAITVAVGSLTSKTCTNIVQKVFGGYRILPNALPNAP